MVGRRAIGAALMAFAALLAGGCGDDAPTEEADAPGVGCPEGAVRLAFSAPAGEEGGDLMALRADGEVVRLTEDGGSYGPAVSPDGAHVAFSSIGTQGSVSDTTGPHGLGIDVVDADGTGRRRLVESVEGSASTGPTWSPDGARIAFAHLDAVAAPARIWVVAADGAGRPGQLVAPEGTAPDSEPAWSPDGERIAFVRGGLTVMVAGADGTAARPVHVQPDGISSLSWSPDGTRIAVAVGEVTETSGRVAIVDLASGAVSTVSEAMRAPSWSASGRLYGFAVPPAIIDPTGGWRVAEIALSEDGGGEVASGRAVVGAPPIGHLYGDAGVATPACDAHAPALTDADDVPESLVVEHPVTGEDVRVLTRDQAEELLDTVYDPGLPDGLEITSKLVFVDGPLPDFEDGTPPELVWVVDATDVPPDELGAMFDATSGRYLGGARPLDQEPWSGWPDLAPPP